MSQDFNLEAEFCSNGNMKKCDKSKLTGTWKLLERHQLYVELSNGVKFASSMRYDLNPKLAGDWSPAQILNHEKQILKKDKKDLEKKFITDCTETMIGFMMDASAPSKITEHPTTCFYA